MRETWYTFCLFLIIVQAWKKVWSKLTKLIFNLFRRSFFCLAAGTDGNKGMKICISFINRVVYESLQF